MNARTINAFADELEKQAVAPLMSRLWASHLARSAGGALAGGAAGALATPENRVRGALMGAAVGGVGGYASPLVTRAGRKAAGEAVKRFGETQKHFITGRGSVPVSSKMKPGDVAKLRAAESAGLTSVPGIARGMVKKPGETVRGLWGQMGTTGKVLTGADLAMNLPKAVGEGSAEDIAGTLGTSGGYFLGSRLPFLGSLALGSGLGYLTSKAGRGVDILRGKKREKEFKPERPTTALAKQEAGKLMRNPYAV
jgi:hypothetical protein